jgi:hypothetical protein
MQFVVRSLCQGCLSESSGSAFMGKTDGSDLKRTASG